MEFGCIHLYYGNGKGKTSILNGSVIRALKYNARIEYLSFFKNRDSGEFRFFKEELKDRIKFTSFYHFSKKFIWDMSQDEQAEFKKESLKGFEYFKKITQAKNIDLILADEMLDLVTNKMISDEQLANALKNKAKHIEIMISGHMLPQATAKVADLISEVKLVKHYFNKNIMARKGVEY